MSRSARPSRSLQAKALQLLAQREQSGVELRRKLIAHARSVERAEAEAKALLDPDPDRDPDRGRVSRVRAGSRHGVVTGSGLVAAPGDATTDPSGLSVEARVDAVLVWLEAHRFASDERFAESRVHARQGRFGNLRIRQELATHGIVLAPEAARSLADSELQRAIDVCRRRFDQPAVNPAEAARHARFLIARGFSPSVARQALRSRARDAVAGPVESVLDDPDAG